MKPIDVRWATHLLNQEPCTSTNTRICVLDGVAVMLLHEKPVARYTVREAGNDELSICLMEEDTQLTRERVNGVLFVAHDKGMTERLCRIVRQNGVPHMRRGNELMAIMDSVVYNIPLVKSEEQAA